MAESLGGNDASSDEYQSLLQSSRISRSLSLACDFYYDPFCEVCFETRDRNVKHEGFCTECVQFLCEDCLMVHRKLQGTRGHEIQLGDEMPKSMADKPPRFSFCDTHLRSRKDKFCPTHKALLCSQCVSSHHNDCRVASVEDACRPIPSSEIDALYDKVRDFKTNLTSVIAELDLNITELGKINADILKEVEDKKVKVMAKLDKLFQEMKTEAESTFQTRISDLGRDSRKLASMIERLDGSLTDIHKLKGNAVEAKVFLQIQDILKDVEQCKSDAETLQLSPLLAKMAFIPDKWLEEFLSSTFKIGTMKFVTSEAEVAITVPEMSFPMSIDKSLTVPQRSGVETLRGASGHQVTELWTPLSMMKAKKVTSYNAKLDDDPVHCTITGMVIMNDGKRLLVDFNNWKIKLFSPDMKPLCSLSLTRYAKPYALAVTGDREAIVSCYNDAIFLIVDISEREMSVKETIKLPFTVRGVTPYRDKLIVTSLSTSPSSVKLIDRSGRVYWSTDIDKNGRPLFTRPWYVSCSDGGAAIVSDNNNILTVMNAETGDIITRCHVKWKGLTGVTADTAGNIYVCYHNTGEVAVLAKDLSREKILLSRKGGLANFPQAIVYHAKDHQLLVSNASEDSSNCIDCFALQ